MQAKLTFPLRRLLLPLCALLALATLAHAAWWWWLTGRLEAGRAAWVAARRAEGWQVAHGAPQRGGWPRLAQLALPEPRLRAPDGTTWQADRLDLRLSPLRPDRLLLATMGPQLLVLDGWRLPFSALGLTASLPLTAAPVPFEGQVEAEGLRAELPRGPLTLRQGALRFTWRGAGATSFAIALAGLRAPALPPALGEEVQSLAAQGSLQPTLPAPTARQVAAWRAAGGRLDLQELDLRWGPLRASGTARLGLDAALQPEGEARLELSGLPETLEAMRGAGLLTPAAASGLRGMVALLQRPVAGEAPRLTLPLVLAQGRLAVAGFPLAQLPPLRWARGPGLD